MRIFTSSSPFLSLTLSLSLLSIAGAPAHARSGTDSCAWLTEAGGLRVDAQFTWSVSGAVDYGTSTIHRAWQASAALARTGTSGDVVEFGAQLSAGDFSSASYALEDVYAYDTGTEHVRGAGTPKDGEVMVRVNRTSCAIDADFWVSGEVETTSPQGNDVAEANIGDVFLIGVVTVEEFLGGTVELPHFRDAALDQSHFFPGWFTSAEVALMDADLGTASLTWSIEPLEAP